MVAKINRVPKAAAKYARYLEKEAADLDPAFRIRAYGRGAKRLGIYGKALTIEEFKNLAVGLSPDGKARLGRSHRHRQWGFEALFSAPSGVSKGAEVLDFEGAKKLAKCVEKSALAAMEHIERTAAYTRVSKNGAKRREPIGVIYFVFTHYANRKGEPNFHTHVVVLSRGVRANGQWAAIENAHVFNAQKATHRVFNQALAYHVPRDLDLKVVRAKKTLRIKGVDDEWARTDRREDIKRERQQNGANNHQGLLGDVLKLRDPKSKTTFGEHWNRWREQAHRAGRYAADLGTRTWTACNERVQEYRADRCYKRAAKYVRLSVTSFRAHKVDEVASLFATTRNISPERLATASEKFRSRPEKYGLRVTGEKLGEPVYTSSGRMSREEKLHNELAKLSGKKRSGLSERRVATSLAGWDTEKMFPHFGGRASDARFQQSWERERAKFVPEVRRITSAKGFVAVPCETPDDTALRMAVRAYRENKVPVLGVGTSPTHANSIHRWLDVDSHTALGLCEKMTPPSHWKCITRGFLHGKGNPHERMGYAERMRRSSPQLPKGCVVVADLRSDQVLEMRALTKAVNRAGGKLIVIGPDSAKLAESVDRIVNPHKYATVFQKGPDAAQPAVQSSARSLPRRGYS